MSHNHFTLGFALKSPADAKAVAEQLPPLMPALFQAEDAIGTIHYSRFTVLSEKTLLFLGDFDGEFSQLMAELAKHAGPVFDAIPEDKPPVAIARVGPSAPVMKCVPLNRCTNKSPATPLPYAFHFRHWKNCSPLNGIFGAVPKNRGQSHVSADASSGTV